MGYNADTMRFEVPDTDTVYISGLPPDTTEANLGEYFGSIGVIKIDKKLKKPKIWLYRDKATGALKGDGTVSYEDPFSAASAIEWFNNKEWKGCMLTVTLSERKVDPSAYQRGGFGGGGGGSRGGGGGGGGFGGGGGQQRDGDWTCSQCGNTNFARRFECNKCRTPKEGGGGGGGGGYGGGGDRGGYGGGRGGGGGGREGDWNCPQCGNNCFAFRKECNKCQTPKPGGGGGGGGRDDRGGYGGSGGGRDDRGGYGGGGYGGGGGGRDRERSPVRGGGRDDRGGDRGGRSYDRY